MSNDEDLLMESFLESILNSSNIKKGKKDYYADLKDNGWSVFKFKISKDTSKSLYYIFTAPETTNVFTAKTARKQQKLNQEIVNILYEF